MYFNEKNYNDAFKKIDTNVPKSWYCETSKNITGIMWHFTDINNMANILNTLKIESKNKAMHNGNMVNDNSATIVNNEKTSDWVHDYARFYLRPKTPTQYRNEGIYPENLEDIRKSKKDFYRLYNREGEIWINKPAHLPIPIFIGFDLKKALMCNKAIMTRSSLATHKYLKVDEAVDANFNSFSENINDIYKEGYADNKIKHTEVIVRDGYEFSKKDIVKIVVRTEIERLMLLTMLAKNNAELVGRKEQHDVIDFIDYANKIVVDNSFFYYDACMATEMNGSNIEFGYIGKDNRKRKENNLNISNEEEIYHINKGGNLVVVPKMKVHKFKLVDINNEIKHIGIINDPYYILSTNLWRNKRYYSYIYLSNKVICVYRIKGENKWYNKQNNKEISLSFANELKEIEESIQVKKR